MEWFDLLMIFYKYAYNDIQRFKTMSDPVSFEIFDDFHNPVAKRILF